MGGFQLRASDNDAGYLAMLQTIGNLAGDMAMPQTIWQCSQLSDSAPRCLTMLPAVSKCFQLSDNSISCLTIIIYFMANIHIIVDSYVVNVH